MLYIPIHSRAVGRNPLLQVQLNEPSVLMQLELVGQLPERSHSFISVLELKNNYECTVISDSYSYIRLSHLYIDSCLYIFDSPVHISDSYLYIGLLFIYWTPIYISNSYLYIGLLFIYRTLLFIYRTLLFIYQTLLFILNKRGAHSNGIMTHLAPP